MEAQFDLPQPRSLPASATKRPHLCGCRATLVEPMAAQGQLPADLRGRRAEDPGCAHAAGCRCCCSAERMAATRLSIFPLPGAILFPGLQLPLHIFEPRYRELVGAALARDRQIALIQPQSTAEGAPLFEMGCLGRIDDVEALEDGRYTRPRRSRALPPFRELEVWHTYRRSMPSCSANRGRSASSPSVKASSARRAGSPTSRATSSTGIQSSGLTTWC